MKSTTERLLFVTFAAAFVLGIVLSPPVWSHCDTLEGPVIDDARAALNAESVTPVLKWVDDKHEDEIREAFAKTLAVRKEGETARELADHYFFETLVRIHRATEGFGYTGLRSESTVDPKILEADRALETGSVDELVSELSTQVADELRTRFAEAHEKKQHAEDSVRQGRAYVGAYVRFVHFVEAIRTAVTAEDFYHAAEHASAEHETPEHEAHD